MVVPQHINPSPTAFPELNALLHELTERARQILGSNFAGAYVQGSFAVGDADMHSDCDFLVPVHDRITSQQEVGLRAMHAEFPTRPEHWAKHLEGSYPVREELSSLAGVGKEWLFIDHGWREMQWSTHCNSEVVRWSLRERGITLCGPDPRTWVDEIPPEALRARMRETIATLLHDLTGWISLDIAWAQRYAVTTLCRKLYTLDRAEVASKRAALLWAQRELDPTWVPLIQQVLDDRVLGFDAQQRPRPGSLERTLAFDQYARELAKNTSVTSSQ